MSNILDVAAYHPQKEEKFLIDANIWLFLFCPLGGYKTHIIKKYDRFLKQAMTQNAGIFVSALILSEFINRYLRLEFNLLRTKDPAKYADFKKDFRNTTEGKALVQIVYDIIKRQILTIATPIADQFHQMKMDELLTGTEGVDFNDVCYLHLANLEDLKVVTDDSDFSTSPLNVTFLTGNPRLLQGRAFA